MTSQLIIALPNKGRKTTLDTKELHKYIPISDKTDSPTIYS